jgi:hypothetical protein
MLSKREREYVSDKEEFGMQHGLEYVRVLRGRIKKKAEQAIKDLVLIAEGDEDFEELERKTKQWGIYKILRDGASGIYTKKELAAYYLNPPKHGNSARRIIRPGDIEELVMVACISYPISGDIVGELISRADQRLKYRRSFFKKA